VLIHFLKSVKDYEHYMLKNLNFINFFQI